MASKLAVVFATNEDYARGLAVAISSCLAHVLDDDRPNIYVLDDGISDASRARLHRVIERLGAHDRVHWITAPRERFLSHSGNGASPATYLRLLLADLLPEHVTRALYVDADVLVQADLTPLLNSALDGAPVGAVRDYAIGTTDHPWAGLESVRPPRTYMNAGILLIDLERWRAAALGERTLSYAAGQRERLSWEDQGALNAVVPRWCELDLTWNVQLLNLAVAERLPHTDLTDDLVARRRALIRDGAILHFVGPNPWSTRSTVAGTTRWVRWFVRSGWYSPLGAAAWVTGWACGWAPRRVLWLLRRTAVRLMTTRPLAPVLRGRIPRRRSPVAS